MLRLYELTLIAVVCQRIIGLKAKEKGRRKGFTLNLSSPRLPVAIPLSAIWPIWRKRLITTET